MKIPMLDLPVQLASYREDVLAAITRVVDTQRFIMGPEVTGFEAELATYTGLAGAVGVSSGTDALLAALMDLGVGPGDEVVTTPFSFFATAGVIARLGATPVFADIDPATFNLSESGLRAALTSRTRAVIPVHLYGQFCDLGGFYAEADRPPIIEDAAQALGAKFTHRGVGHFGEYACVSFFPAKNLGAFGDGGGVLCADEARAERIRILRVHGSKPKYHHHVVGGNFRLDALQAAVLRVKLPYLDQWAAGRRRNAARYAELFAEAGLLHRGIVTLPFVHPNAYHVYNQFVIRVPQRDALRAHLSDRGVGSMVYYPRPLHLQPCFSDLGYGPGDFPIAEKACHEVLALPIYPELTEAHLQRVVGEVADFFDP